MLALSEWGPTSLAPVQRTEDFPSVQARKLKYAITYGTQGCSPSLAVGTPPMMRYRANAGTTIIMRIFPALLVLVGHCFVSHTAAAAQSQDCNLFRED